MGDINAIASPIEHKGGPFRYYANKGQLFSDFIGNNSLLNVGFISPIFSWCNNQSGSAKRWAILNRCLANPQ